MEVAPAAAEVGAEDRAVLLDQDGAVEREEEETEAEEAPRAAASGAVLAATTTTTTTTIQATAEGEAV